MSFTVLPGFPLRSAILSYYTPKNVVVPDVRVDVTFDDADGSLRKTFGDDPLLLNAQLAAQGEMKKAALELAGFTAALYPGSFSEWSNRPGLPVASV